MTDQGQCEFDVVVLGAGAVGCATARDAVGRGLRVLLVEEGDIGQPCLRSFVRQELSRHAQKDTDGIGPSDRRLLRVCPHLLDPNKLPPAPKRRRFFGSRQEPPPMDHLRSLEASQRFAAQNLQDALERGAHVTTGTKITQATRTNGGWQITLMNAAERHVQARLIVDTWGALDTEVAPEGTPEPGYFARKQQLLAQIALVARTGETPGTCVDLDSGGVLLIAPAGEGFDLIARIRPENMVSLDPQDMAPDHLLQLAQTHAGYSSAAVAPMFQAQFTLTDPSLEHELVDDLQTDHVMRIKTVEGRLPLIRIRGGAAAQARVIAEDVVAEMAPFVKMIGKRWTGTSPLPGGDFRLQATGDMLDELQERYRFLTPALARRLFRTYGTEARRILSRANSPADLGNAFGADLFESEIRWLMEKERAQTAEDILWRRTKLGLTTGAKEVRKLSDWMAKHAAA